MSWYESLNLPSLEECLEKSENEPKCLLLGNGFSQTLSSKFRFSILKACIDELISEEIIQDFLNEEGVYFEDKLAEIAHQIEKEKNRNSAVKVLNSEEVKNYPLPFVDGIENETVINGLTKGLEKISSEDQSSVKLDNLEKKYNLIKDLLLRTVEEVHPGNPKSINLVCRRENPNIVCSLKYFLEKFSAVYTLNYDLMLCWITAATKDSRFRDGFCKEIQSKIRLYWEKEFSDINLFYLHGALHLFQDQEGILKFKYHRGQNLKKQIKGCLDENIFPIFISEGSAESKLQKIQANEYLKFCFEQLRRIGHTLFIFGHSLAENDWHIFEQIFHKDTQIKKCYVGLYSMGDYEKFYGSFLPEFGYKYPHIKFIPYQTETSSQFLLENTNAPECLPATADNLDLTDDSYYQKKKLIFTLSPSIGFKIGSPMAGLPKESYITLSIEDEKIKKQCERDFLSGRFFHNAHIECDILKRRTMDDVDEFILNQYRFIDKKDNS